MEFDVERGLDLLVSIVGIATVGQYLWSMRAHFQSSGMSSGATIISVVVAATALFFLAIIWILPQPPLAKIVGLAVQLVSSALFWWAILRSRKARLRFVFDADDPHGLVTDGPFFYLRHPFYTSYIIFWAGWGIATWSIWAVVPVAGIFVLYLIAALEEEKKFSRTEMADAYAAHRKRAGLFWPRLPKSGRRDRSAMPQPGGGCVARGIDAKRRREGERSPPPMRHQFED